MVGLTMTTDEESAILGTATGSLSGLVGPEAEEGATAHVVDVVTEGACWNTLYLIMFQFSK